jgi:hypothetical protein
VRELAAEQRNALAKVTAAQAAAVERLDALDRSETHMDAVALVEGAVGQVGGAGPWGVLISSLSPGSTRSTTW